MTCSAVLCPTPILISPFIMYYCVPETTSRKPSRVTLPQCTWHPCGSTSLASPGFSGPATMTECYLPGHPPSRARRSCSGLLAEAVL